jgi:hypothetical protein
LLSALPRAPRCQRTYDVSPRRGRVTSRQPWRQGAPPAQHGYALCLPRGSPPALATLLYAGAGVWQLCWPVSNFVLSDQCWFRTKSYNSSEQEQGLCGMPTSRARTKSRTTGLIAWAFGHTGDNKRVKGRRHLVSITRTAAEALAKTGLQRKRSVRHGGRTHRLGHVSVVHLVAASPVVEDFADSPR